MGEIFDESHQGATPEDQIRRPLLKKPFFAYDPGAQRSLNYNMPVDPKEYRFGKRQAEAQPTVSECMMFQNLNPNTQTELSRKTVEDFKAKRRDALGVGRTNQSGYQSGPRARGPDAVQRAHQDQDGRGRRQGLPDHARARGPA